jgi:hypothetical protein
MSEEIIIVGEAFPRITQVNAVSYGFLKLSWTDGYEGVLDIRPFIAKGEIFEAVRHKDNFFNVQLGYFGHSIIWKDSEDNEIDLGSDSLRRDCEKQEQIHKLMAV